MEKYAMHYAPYQDTYTFTTYWVVDSEIDGKNAPKEAVIEAAQDALNGILEVDSISHVIHVVDKQTNAIYEVDLDGDNPTLRQRALPLSLRIRSAGAEVGGQPEVVNTNQHQVEDLLEQLQWYLYATDNSPADAPDALETLKQCASEFGQTPKSDS